jgi:hypothetical protein
MTAQHTPGPWFFNQEPGSCWTIKAGHNSIMGNEQYYPWVPGERADWMLIAAAPDLLEALQTFLDEYVALVVSGDAGNWDAEEENKVKAARAAIAKATGAAQ